MTVIDDVDLIDSDATDTPMRNIYTAYVPSTIIGFNNVYPCLKLALPSFPYLTPEVHVKPLYTSEALHHSRTYCVRTV